MSEAPESLKITDTSVCMSIERLPVGSLDIEIDDEEVMRLTPAQAVGLHGLLRRMLAKTFSVRGAT